MQKNSITFTQLWHQSWFKNLLQKVSINLVKKFAEIFYRSKGVKPISYSLSVVSESKVLIHLNASSVYKPMGLDGIPSRVDRESASIIVCPLTHIINLSIIQGVIPDDLKSARVVPLFKYKWQNGGWQLPSNFDLKHYIQGHRKSCI